jgi:hypothetical protein
LSLPKPISASASSIRFLKFFAEPGFETDVEVDVEVDVENERPLDVDFAGLVWDDDDDEDIEGLEGLEGSGRAGRPFST